ncbi:MAG: DUF1801 domain-containing protein [Planctomycetota bacterium]
MKKNATTAGESPSRLIDERIKLLDDWRGKTLSQVRALIRQADPEVVEEWKWGTPVWSHHGIICTGETYKKAVKLTFAQGARVPDPSRLFNSSLEGNTRRAIDIHQGEKIDAAAFKSLVKAAAAQNGPQGKSVAKAKSPARSRAKSKLDAEQAKPSKKRKPRNVVLLSGGNPQIAMADGDAPVQAYIASMPGWKRDLGSRLDALIARSVPDVRKAVKWNSPFYGVEGQGWFLSFHTYTQYVKVAFFHGTSLRPLPPGASKVKGTRYLDIHEDDVLDEARMATWVKQAAALPGWIPGRTP